MKTTVRNQLPAVTLTVVGGLAIIASGILSAFTASDPTRAAMWASAYLVLVVGVAQVVFGLSLLYLAKTAPRQLAWLVFILYNLGNLGVLLGTLWSVVSMVVVGGGLIIAAVAILFYLMRRAKKSWLLTGFYLTAVVILVSTPIGMLLAMGSH